MSTKLNQSLDEILSSQRRAASTRRRSARRSSTNAKGTPAATAPAGGIQKAKSARNTNKAPARASGAVGESKIMVSNLPKDVSEGQIKDYFQQSVGQVKKVELSYGPGGVSRGIAHISFHHADSASKAFKAVNGILIDNRPVKVEVIVSSAELIPEPKSLGQRVTQPKAQPKSAANVKHGAGVKGATGKAAQTKKPARKGRNNRPAKKTAEELDSDMADYFDNTNNENANTAAPAPANGDATMVDEVL